MDDMTVHIASHRAPEHFMPFQKELCFDDELVLQQLRYTGMLETVRIRRSGYSAKYTFQVGRPHRSLCPAGVVTAADLERSVN